MKRSKGKNNSDINVEDIYKYYKSKVDNPIDIKIFRKFYKEMFSEFSELLLQGKEIKLNNIGEFKIIEYKPKLIKEGKINTKAIAPDWARTKEYWNTLYPGKTLKELKNIENKPIIYHENDHTNGQQYKYYWDKITTELKCKSAYQFKPVRKYKRKLSSILKDKNINIFYYRK